MKIKQSPLTLKDLREPALCFLIGGMIAMALLCAALIIDQHTTFVKVADGIDSVFVVKK